MKTVVITGSTRGLGFEMAKLFRQNGWNLVINGVSAARMEKAAEELGRIPGTGEIAAFAGSVANASDLDALAAFAAERFGSVDIWINNAGVNQPMKAIWELNEDEIDAVLNIDLRGAILGSRVAVRLMEKQAAGGFVYNIEGYGSNDAMMLGLNLYGTSKRAVTHFTQALARELEERGSKVKAGRLSPGIMITDFTVKALGGKESIALPEKTKKVYNILGDYPETIVDYCVPRMLKNTKNDARIMWLTNRRVFGRFLTAGFKKRDFFS